MVLSGAPPKGARPARGRSLDPADARPHDAYSSPVGHGRMMSPESSDVTEQRDEQKNRKMGGPWITGERTRERISAMLFFRRLEDRDEL
jgi:hypothetical protein